MVRQLSTARLKIIYGLTKARTAKQLVSVTLSFGDGSVNLKVHRKALNRFKLAIALANYDMLPNKAGGRVRYTLKPKRCYGYMWRRIKLASGGYGKTLSKHSHGIAIDINAFAPNGQGANAKHNIPSRIIKAFEEAGFIWGGRWTGSYKDPMHFELAIHSDPYLYIGRKNPHVTLLQRRLNAKGYACKVTGKFTKGTANALNKYKAHMGWPEDGIAGANTLVALKVYEVK